MKKRYLWVLRSESYSSRGIRGIREKGEATLGAETKSNIGSS